MSEITLNGIPKEVKKGVLIEAIRTFVCRKKGRIKHLQLNFIGRDAMFNLNMKHLDKGDDTDTITFNYGNKKAIESEVYISDWAIRKSAKERRDTIKNEFLIVIGHSILHSLDYTDKTIEGRSCMSKGEAEFLKLYEDLN